MIYDISYFLVKWRNIEYNIGNHFNGTIFTAPVAGLYSFFAMAKHRGATYTRIRLYVNGNSKIVSTNETKNDDIQSLPLQSTLKLGKNDTVEMRVHGTLYDAGLGNATYFEGRLISRIDE